MLQYPLMHLPVHSACSFHSPKITAAVFTDQHQYVMWGHCVVINAVIPVVIPLAHENTQVK